MADRPSAYNTMTQNDTGNTAAACFEIDSLRKEFYDRIIIKTKKNNTYRFIVEYSENKFETSSKFIGSPTHAIDNLIFYNTKAEAVTNYIEYAATYDDNVCYLDSSNAPSKKRFVANAFRLHAVNSGGYSTLYVSEFYPVMYSVADVFYGRQINLSEGMTIATAKSKENVINISKDGFRMWGYAGNLHANIGLQDDGSYGAWFPQIRIGGSSWSVAPFKTDSSGNVSIEATQSSYTGARRDGIIQVTQNSTDYSGQFKPSCFYGTGTDITVLAGQINVGANIGAGIHFRYMGSASGDYTGLKLEAVESQNQANRAFAFYNVRGIDFAGSGSGGDLQEYYINNRLKINYSTDAVLRINNRNTGYYSFVELQDAGIARWQILKHPDNSFSIYQCANAYHPFSIDNALTTNIGGLGFKIPSSPNKDVVFGDGTGWHLRFLRSNDNAVALDIKDDLSVNVPNNGMSIGGTVDIYSGSTVQVRLGQDGHIGCNSFIDSLSWIKGTRAYFVRASLAEQAEIYLGKGGSSNWAIYIPNNVTNQLKIWSSVGSDILTLNDDKSSSFAGTVNINGYANAYNTMRTWTAYIRCSTWSRIMNIAPYDGVAGASFILNIAYTRRNVVCNASFMVNVAHSSTVSISQLGNVNYSNFSIRGVAASENNFLIELLDSNSDNSIYQSVVCNVLPLNFNGFSRFTPYTDFQDGTTIPSGYVESGKITTVSGASFVGNFVKSCGSVIVGNQDVGSYLQINRYLSNEKYAYVSTTNTADTGMKFQVQSSDTSWKIPLTIESNGTLKLVQENTQTFIHFGRYDASYPYVYLASAIVNNSGFKFQCKNSAGTVLNTFILEPSGTVTICGTNQANDAHANTNTHLNIYNNENGNNNNGIFGSDNLGTAYYLALGRSEYKLNGYMNIGFGYKANGVHYPATIGFQMTNTGGQTSGDLVFATRNGITDVVPTERLRLNSIGNAVFSGAVSVGGTSVNSYLMINRYSEADKFGYIMSQGVADNGLKFQVCNANGNWVQTFKIESNGVIESASKHRFSKNNSAIDNSSYGNGNLEIITSDTSNPIIGFHRAGYTAIALYHADYAVNNLLRIRSAAGGDYSLWHEGNFNPANYAPLSGANFSGGVTVTKSTSDALVTLDTGTSYNSGIDLKYGGTLKWRLLRDWGSNDFLLYDAQGSVESLRIYSTGNRAAFYGSITTKGSFGCFQTSGSGNGISLYGNDTYTTTYGIMFATTGNFGTHGYVTADWATYFNMNSDSGRGWVFRANGVGNVASISAGGSMCVNNYLTVGSSTVSSISPFWVAKKVGATTGIFGQTDQCPVMMYQYSADYTGVAFNAYHNGTSWYNITGSKSTFLIQHEPANGALCFYGAPAVTAGGVPQWVKAFSIGTNGTAYFGGASSLGENEIVITKQSATAGIAVNVNGSPSGISVKASGSYSANTIGITTYSQYTYGIKADSGSNISIYSNKRIQNNIAVLDVGGSYYARFSSDGILMRDGSSLRYKTEINELPSALSTLKILKPVSFKWKTTGNFDFGVIAEWCPEFLQVKNKDNVIDSVSYQMINMITLKATQEQQIIIEQQEARIAELETKLAEILELLTVK